MASTIAELQAQVDDFDHIYNTEQGNQALPGRMTPQRCKTPPKGTRRTRIAGNGTITLASIMFPVSRSCRHPDRRRLRPRHDHRLHHRRRGSCPAHLDPGVRYVSTYAPDPTNHRGGRGHKRTPTTVTEVPRHHKWVQLLNECKAAPESHRPPPEGMVCVRVSTLVPTPRPDV